MEEIEMKSIIGFIILSLFSSYAIADEISHKAAAEELILLSNPEQMLEQIYAQVRGMVDQQFQQMGAPEELRPIFKKYTEKISIYVKTYTESEIRAISEFYKSPAGKAFLEEMPTLIQESMSMTQRKMPQIMEKVQAISKEMAEELIESLKNQQQMNNDAGLQEKGI
jgi:hypothetical protein